MIFFRKNQRNKKQGGGRIRPGILWLLLALLLSAGLLFGCGKTEEAQSAPETAAANERELIGLRPTEVGPQAQGTTPAAGGGASQDTDAVEAIPIEDIAPQEAQEPALAEDGSYTTKEDVALYLHTYGRLPYNFITKDEARALGWSGGSLEEYAPGKCIGGDHFGNYEGRLPKDKKYKECDIDTLGKKSRGAKRLIYATDGSIYYTGDHYEHFEQLY